MSAYRPSEPRGTGSSLAGSAGSKFKKIEISAGVFWLKISWMPQQIDKGGDNHADDPKRHNPKTGFEGYLITIERDLIAE